MILGRRRGMAFPEGASGRLQFAARSQPSKRPAATGGSAVPRRSRGPRPPKPCIPTARTKLFLLPPQTPQHLAVELRGQALPLRVRPRRIRPGLDTELALLADVPVLPVGHVPELDAVVGIERRVAEGGGMEEPGAGDERAVGPL